MFEILKRKYLYRTADFQQISPKYGKCFQYFTENYGKKWQEHPNYYRVLGNFYRVTEFSTVYLGETLPRFPLKFDS